MHNNSAGRLFQAAVALGCLWLSADADAQLVRVGPLGGVSLRLPFVSVDTLPFGGGASVRAPFTSVDTGLYGLRRGGLGYRGYGYGYGVGSPYVGIPVYPSWPLGYPSYPPPSYRSPRLDSYQFEHYQFDRYGLDRYGLDRYPPDPYVLDQVELDRVDRYARVEALADTRGDLAYRSARPSLESALESSLESTMEQAIEQSLASPPVDPIAEQSLRLRQSAARLQRSLYQRNDDAEVWLDYLQPGLIVDVIDGLSEEDALPRLEALYLNYEGVAGNADLTSIWSADGFRQTHRGLRDYLDTRQGIVEVPGPPTIVAPEAPFQPQPQPQTFETPQTLETYELLPTPKRATL